MADAARFPLPGTRHSEYRIIAGISAAHFVSHYYMLLLPPLFAFVRDDFGVSYIELGLAITVFNVATTLVQTPAGFLVDRVGPRIVLIAGLVLGAGAFAIVGLINSYWVMLVMFAIAGLGNAVYHPADYAMLAQHVSSERIGQAYSIHTFAGILGSAVAPASVLFMQSQIGWQGAFVGASLLGFAVAALLFLVGADDELRAPAAGSSSTTVRQTDAKPAAKVGWQLLLSPAILINLVFFFLLSAMFGGLNNFLVVALGVLHQTPAFIANVTLSAMLFFSAFGVLAGGLLVSRTSHFVLITIFGLLVMAAASLLIGVLDTGNVLLVVIMAVGGFFGGLIMPSRDMIVRSVTPPGAFGRVFGFVTMGLNISLVVTPLIFGMMMDHNYPLGIFIAVGVCGVLSAILVLIGSMQRAPA